MTVLVMLLISAYIIIVYQCYKHAKNKGYSLRLFCALAMIPYFNLVVWMYLLFLPPLDKTGLGTNHVEY